MKKPINCRIISSNLEDKTLGLKFELAKGELLEIDNKEYIIIDKESFNKICEEGLNKNDVEEAEKFFNENYRHLFRNDDIEANSYQIEWRQFEYRDNDGKRTLFSNKQTGLSSRYFVNYAVWKEFNTFFSNDKVIGEFLKRMLCDCGVWCTEIYTRIITTVTDIKSIEIPGHCYPVVHQIKDTEGGKIVNIVSRKDLDTYFRETNYETYPVYYKSGLANTIINWEKEYIQIDSSKENIKFTLMFK